MHRIYEEQCELFIEQEIEEFVKNGIDEENITQKAKQIQDWVLKTFNRVIKEATVRQRIYRRKVVTLSQPDITAPNDTENEEKPTKTDRDERGLFRSGTAPGPGRPPKFAVVPDNTQFRTSGTGENEWYTPPEYIEAARDALGDIDLDPASSEFGQSRVQAAQYFTVENDGLTQPWYGRVFLNPPYSQPLIQQFIEKLIHEYRSARVDSAILLVHNYTDTRWFHIAEAEAEAICFTLGRIKFEGADGSVASPTQGQAFLYYGPQPGMFYERFKDIGFVR